MHLKFQFLVFMGRFLFGPEVGSLAVNSKRYAKATEAAAYTKIKGRGGLLICVFSFFLRKDNSLLLVCIKWVVWASSILISGKGTIHVGQLGNDFL